ncbi:MAG: hypothetical protein LCH92_08225 [Proteobacteria bacterium]|nr:hypothetical protein [Pseudomonadota bacterium]
MSDEWGPWVKHDGKGLPVPVGTVVMVEDVHSDGSREIFVVTAGLGGGFSWDWQWSVKLVPGFNKYATRIIRYRIRRPKALREMIDRAESLPVVAPKRVEPAGPLEVM